MSTPSRPPLHGWIGVDLDATLAHYDGWRGGQHIGAPIEPMIARVRSWIAEGREVRVFTARASDPEQVPPVRAWLDGLGLSAVGITNVKDFAMVELWDDRCVQVQPNTGIAYGPSRIDGDVHVAHVVQLLADAREQGRREGAEEMRERAAQCLASAKWHTDTRFSRAQRDEVEAIRALPLTPEPSNG